MLGTTVDETTTAGQAGRSHPHDSSLDIATVMISCQDPCVERYKEGSQPLITIMILASLSLSHLSPFEVSKPRSPEDLGDSHHEAVHCGAALPTITLQLFS
jgi:hypothetical protein